MKVIKQITKTLMVLALLALFGTTNAQAAAIETFSFSSLFGSGIVFSPGGTFDFVENGSGFDFGIGLQDGSFSGGLVGLSGNIDATSFSFTDPGPGGTIAPVSTSSGMFSIFDGIDTFSTDLDFFTLNSASGGQIRGSVSLGGVVSYAGSNAALIQLASQVNQSPDSIEITFQIGNNADLHELFDNGAASTFSGKVTATPEPGSLLLLGSGLSALGLVALRRKTKATQA